MKYVEILCKKYRFPWENSWWRTNWMVWVNNELWFYRVLILKRTDIRLRVVLCSNNNTADQTYSSLFSNIDKQICDMNNIGCIKFLDKPNKCKLISLRYSEYISWSFHFWLIREFLQFSFLLRHHLQCKK